MSIDNITDVEVRNKLDDYNGNTAVLASAGTGKTYQLVKQMEREYSAITNWQTMAAVTFTKKAAKEIENRLGFQMNNGFIGTNDAFVFSEVIKPFIYDAYGDNYKIYNLVQNFHPDNQVENYEEGLDWIMEKGIVPKYRNNSINFGFELALNILKKSEACRNYFTAKYYKIFVDEYQDCDNQMHEFFKYLNSLGVLLFVVGDTKQAIYSFRGGNDRCLQELSNKPNFKKFELTHNFRSNVFVQNYANLMTKGLEHYYLEQEDKNNYIKYYQSEFCCEDTASKIISWVGTKECCILVRTNQVGSDMQKIIEKLRGDFLFLQDPKLEDSRYESESIYLARNCARYLYNDNFNEYVFINELIGDFKYTIIKKHLSSLRKYYNKLEYNEMVGVASELYKEVGIEISEIQNREIELFIEAMTNGVNNNYYNSEKIKRKIMTIHSSKGLQFQKVVIDGSAFLISDLENPDSDGYKLHYVATTRAKEQVLMVMPPQYYDYYCDRIKNINREIAVEIN